MSADKYCRLNLTAASYVHILEPQWNPMVEAQAAARIDRLDQTKDVVIIRYIVEHSIENVHSTGQIYILTILKLIHFSREFELGSRKKFGTPNFPTLKCPRATWRMILWYVTI